MATITKLDAARRQLLAAIHLHWFFIEPIAVYQLATNASEICDAILKKSGGTRIKQHVAEQQGWEIGQLNALINVARNFSKHADRDPEAETEDLVFEDCNRVILTACIDYSMAARRAPDIVGAFIIWFAATNPEKTGSFLSEEAHSLFPGLGNMSRSDQILAARRYVLHPPPSEVLNNARNELSDFWRWKELRSQGQNFRTE
ncbi:hypothetical protein J2W92_000495 [Rhizobium leguminosarum]